MAFKEEALKFNEGGKISIQSKVKLETKEDLSLAYTPGVAEACKKITENKEDSYKYTSRGNIVAVISDGSAVLGLGNIGPEAAMPVMEGKAILFKKFANIDAVPIVLNTQDKNEIIQIIKSLDPSFGGINLEDISAPRCFEIEEALKKEMNIPVFHDDQHGTAIVVLAGLINALKIVNKNKEEIKIILNGAGAAGVAITKLLLAYGVKDIIALDSKGAITKTNASNDSKKELAEITNLKNLEGDLKTIIQNTDVFVGVSAPGVLTQEMIKSMNKNPIIFAMANPVPEIMPDLAKEAGAKIVATGRSDFPNQVNNALVFPGIFRGVLDSRAKQITEEMKLESAKALASIITEPSEDEIIPDIFNPKVVEAVANAVKKVYSKL